MKVTQNTFDDGRILSPSGFIFRMGRAHNACRQQDLVIIAFMDKERGVASYSKEA